MKSKLMISLVAFAALAFAACNNSAPKADNKDEAKTDSTLIAPEAGDVVIYQCPMHPEEISNKPAQCSKCGMDLEKATVRGKDTIRG